MTTASFIERMEKLLAVEQFLYYEARLMDEHKYDEWLSLWTDDAIYFVPCNADDIDPKRHVTLIYDNRKRLEDRITQLKSNSHWSQEPRSRIRRVVSNVELGEEVDGELTVYSNFVVMEVRRNEQMVLCGRSIHKLRHQGDGFKISHKKVLLTNNDAIMRNVRILL
ncbi:MAG TPA: aromatic-ring-hydroxylating dioxygenase subunit beta [Dehalococcoidia bacterium]|nr:aromatic-ring-hydroxylating dioxygenase subunit beta [Dehalococcoidia bacterium]